MFGIGNVTLHTADYQLSETVATPFTLTVTVTCMSEDCHVPWTTENVNFLITSRPNVTSRSPYPLSTINAASSANTVTPPLGASYLYTGHSRLVTIGGQIQVMSIVDLNSLLVL